MCLAVSDVLESSTKLCVFIRHFGHESIIAQFALFYNLSAKIKIIIDSNASCIAIDKILTRTNFKTNQTDNIPSYF